MDATKLIAVLWLVLIILVAITLIIAAIFLRGRRRKSPARPALSDHQPPPAQPVQSIPPAPTSVARLPYARILTLLTSAERDFFAALQAAAPAGLLVFPQVRLANLIQVERWARRNKAHWYRIQAKCVDFVLCDAHTTAPRLVVELDDASHARPDRRARDAFVDAVLAATGLPILHVRWQPRYDPRDLAEHIAAALGHPAPQPPRVLDSSPIAVAAMAAPALAQVIAPTPGPIPNPPAARLSAAPEFATRYACGQCQADIHPDAKFCPSCGAAFTR